MSGSLAERLEEVNHQSIKENLLGHDKSPRLLLAHISVCPSQMSFGFPFILTGKSCVLPRFCIAGASHVILSYVSLSSLFLKPSFLR